jgi:hypothetical protein
VNKLEEWITVLIEMSIGDHKRTAMLMQVAAPMSSPIANPAEADLIAENVESRSGLPFPKARSVTPANDSESSK